MTDIPLFRQPCRFIAGAATIASLPPVSCPEIAFIGRSNVGKSTLVNALIGQKALAKTSQNPGHTKQLNFFNLADRLILVDMPGYGYAKVSKERKGEWDMLIKSYLSGRPTLKRACVLIDARRGVMPPDDAFMRVIDDAALSFQIVLTKIDAITPGDLRVLLQSLEKTIQSHAAAHPQVVATSSSTKAGIEELQEQLLPFAEVENNENT
jgi:GTP-binding protein